MAAYPPWLRRVCERYLNFTTPARHSVPKGHLIVLTDDGSVAGSIEENIFRKYGHLSDEISEKAILYLSSTTDPEVGEFRVLTGFIRTADEDLARTVECIGRELMSDPGNCVLYQWQDENKAVAQAREFGADFRTRCDVAGITSSISRIKTLRAEGCKTRLNGLGGARAGLDWNIPLWQARQDAIAKLAGLGAGSDADDFPAYRGGVLFPKVDEHAIE